MYVCTACSVHRVSFIKPFSLEPTESGDPTGCRNASIAAGYQLAYTTLFISTAGLVLLLSVVFSFLFIYLVFLILPVYSFMARGRWKIVNESLMLERRLSYRSGGSDSQDGEMRGKFF